MICVSGFDSAVLADTRDGCRCVLVASSIALLDPSEISVRAIVVVAVGVVTTIVLLAVIPKASPGIVVAAGDTTTTPLPVTTTVPSSATTTPAGVTTTSNAATTTTKSATTTTRKSGGTSTATASTTTTFPVAGRPVLKLGSTGADVVALQQRLTALGYKPGSANGTFGASTRTAVMNFQKAKNLTADGVVGRATWAALATG